MTSFLESTILGLMLVMLLVVQGCKQQPSDLQTCDTCVNNNDSLQGNGEDAKKFDEHEDRSLEQVNVMTTDGVSIHGTYYVVEKPKAFILLLHMLGRDKEDWHTFAQQFQQDGYGVLAIDLRGHGESILQNGKTIAWRTFSDAEFAAALHDVEAAMAFAEQRDELQHVPRMLMGASIGANLALQYAATHETTISNLVLLSPGLSYRGITTEESMQQYHGQVFLAASVEDEYAYDSTKELYELATGEKKFQEYTNAGHGTEMFAVTDLEQEIFEWVDSYDNQRY